MEKAMLDVESKGRDRWLLKRNHGATITFHSLKGLNLIM